MEDKSMRLNEITLHGIVSLLLKNLWVIAALCISALLCYASVTRLTYTPMYTSSATFMVSAKDGTNAYNSLTITQSMASVFVEVFESNVLRDKVQEKMPMTWRLLHTEYDNLASLTPESFPLMEALLDALAKARTPA